MFSCPVCGFNGLMDDPLCSTFEICSKCGIEFGYDDFCMSYGELLELYEMAGRPVWNHVGTPPWLDF